MNNVKIYKLIFVLSFMYIYINLVNIFKDYLKKRFILGLFNAPQKQIRFCRNLSKHI